MTAQFSMFEPTKFEGIDSATSSPGLEDGPTPSGSQGGKASAGPGPAHASPSRWQVAAKARVTKGTSGLRFGDSSPSAVLSLSLGSRLTQRMAAYGSPEYRLTWKRTRIASGLPVYVQQALAPRTPGKGFTGWPTATAGDARSSGVADYPATDTHHAGTTLTDAARLAGWPTPQTFDAVKAEMADPAANREDRLRRGGASYLAEMVHMSSWPTPTVDDANNVPRESGAFQSLPRSARLVGLDPDTYSAGTEKPDTSRLNPLFEPLAPGLPGRVGLLRGSGNSIVPPLAAEFVRAFMDTDEVRL